MVAAWECFRVLQQRFFGAGSDHRNRQVCLGCCAAPAGESWRKQKSISRCSIFPGQIMCGLYGHW